MGYTKVSHLLAYFVLLSGGGGGQKSSYVVQVKTDTCFAIWKGRYMLMIRGTAGAVAVSMLIDDDWIGQY